MECGTRDRRPGFASLLGLWKLTMGGSSKPLLEHHMFLLQKPSLGQNTTKASGWDLIKTRASERIKKEGFGYSDYNLNRKITSFTVLRGGDNPDDLCTALILTFN